jgi:hypothetical protein
LTKFYRVKLKKSKFHCAIIYMSWRYLVVKVFSSKPIPFLLNYCHLVKVLLFFAFQKLLRCLFNETGFFNISKRSIIFLFLENASNLRNSQDIKTVKTSQSLSSKKQQRGNWTSRMKIDEFMKNSSFFCR